MRETRRVSDRTQKPEAPEPQRQPALAVEVAPVAPVSGLALGQLGSVDAVLALQQSSGNQAVDRVLRGQAAAGEATLPGALGAALAATRPATPKGAARRRADSAASQVANAGFRSEPTPDLTRRPAGNKDDAAVGAGPTTVMGAGFGGAGFVDPVGLAGGAAGYGGTAGARDRWIAAAAAADADETSGPDSGGAGGSVDSGTTDVDGDGVGEDAEADHIDDSEVGGADAEDDEDGAGAGGGGVDAGGVGGFGGTDALLDPSVNLLAGGRSAGHRFAEVNPGASALANPDAERAASQATREDWARRQHELIPVQPTGGQAPGPPVDDALERRRQVEAFHGMTGTGAAQAAGPERSVVTVAMAIDEKEAARARNEATRAQLLAWTSRRDETGET
jgi:hypothetical protein